MPSPGPTANANTTAMADVAADPTNDPIDVAALVQVVKDHAIAHYEHGWDVVHETMDDQELAARITEAGARTGEEAIAAFADLVSVWRERTGPHWPDTFCLDHPTVRLTSVFPEEKPTECAVCIHEQDQQREAPPLWWDDASYIRYQSYDPHYDEDPAADYPQITLLTDHTTDVCDGDTGYGRKHRCPACTARDAEIARDQPPF